MQVLMTVRLTSSKTLLIQEPRRQQVKLHPKVQHRPTEKRGGGQQQHHPQQEDQMRSEVCGNSRVIMQSGPINISKHQIRAGGPTQEDLVGRSPQICTLRHGVTWNN